MRRGSTELNILKITKQDSILIAVTLAIMLSVPLLVPALYGSSTIAVSDLAGDRPGRLSDRNQVGGDYGDARLRGTGPECGLSSGFPI